MGHEEIRVLPQNIDAEKAVLGAMMISEEAIGVSIEHLDSFYFYETSHQKIFDAVRELYAQRKRVDIITLSDWLKNSGQLESLGRHFLSDTPGGFCAYSRQRPVLCGHC
jgi:replicative DNA helicase